MLLRRGPLTADIDIGIFYTLTPVNGGTRLVRDLKMAMQIPGLMRLATPFITAAFRRENLRTLAALKRYCESP